VISGLTPSASMQLKWAWKTTANTTRIHTGPDDGEAVMEVWAAP
jgi:hypothetical protein